MGEDDVVRHGVGLARRVAGEAVLVDVRRAPARRRLADGVALVRVRPRLVERGPGLDAVAELFEANLGEVHVVLAARVCTQLLFRYRHTVLVSLSVSSNHIIGS